MKGGLVMARNKLESRLTALLEKLSTVTTALRAERVIWDLLDDQEYFDEANELADVELQIDRIQWTLRRVLRKVKQ